RVRAGAAAVVRRGHDDAHGPADVGRRQRVGATRRIGDVGAGGARGVAALPLVGERDRRRPAPGAGGGGQGRPVARRAVDGRGDLVDGRVGGDGARDGRRGGARPAGVRRRDGDAQRPMDVVGAGGVGRIRGAGDGRAVRAVGVAAPPLVGERDRLRAVPGARVGGEGGAVRRRTGDGRRGAHGRRDRVDGRGRGRGRPRRARDVRGRDGDAQGSAHVGRGRAVRALRRAGDVGAPGPVGAAAAPLVGVVDRGRAGPGPLVGGERRPVARRAGDRGRRGARGRDGG